MYKLMTYLFALSTVLVTGFACWANEGPPVEQDTLGDVASNSRQLHVDSLFNFETFKTVSLDLGAFNSHGDAYANAMIFVYSVESSGLDESNSQYKRSLLAIVKTDYSGNVIHQLEVSDSVTAIEMELRVIGVENILRANLEDGLYVQHIFYE